MQVSADADLWGRVFSLDLPHIAGTDLGGYAVRHGSPTAWCNPPAPPLRKSGKGSCEHGTMMPFRSPQVHPMLEKRRAPLFLSVLASRSVCLLPISPSVILVPRGKSIPSAGRMTGSQVPLLPSLRICSQILPSFIWKVLRSRCRRQFGIGRPRPLTDSPSPDSGDGRGEIDMRKRSSFTSRYRDYDWRASNMSNTINSIKNNKFQRLHPDCGSRGRQVEASGSPQLGRQPGSCWTSWLPGMACRLLGCRPHGHCRSRRQPGTRRCAGSLAPGVRVAGPSAKLSP